MKYYTLDYCGSIHKVLDKIGWSKIDDIKEAEAVIFGGGTDISTSLYRQVPIKETQSPDLPRDRKEREILKSLGKDVWKIGICRGSQLLCAIAGGSLWQHANNHSGTHQVSYFDAESKGWLVTTTNSVHHQICRPPDGAIVLAVANEATILKDAHETIQVINSGECEVWAWPENKLFGFQGHPEYGHKETSELFVTLLTQTIEGKVK